jgi:hypothetical protein
MKTLITCLVTLTLLIAGCKSNSAADDNVKISNKTNKNIVCLLGYNYPDLSFSFTNKQAVLAKLDKFEVDGGQSKAIDTLGLCNKEIWDKHIKDGSMLMLFVFDKNKLASADKLEDALLERYYFSFIQLMKTNGLITIK